MTRAICRPRPVGGLQNTSYSLFKVRGQDTASPLFLSQIRVELFESCLQQKEISARDSTLLLRSEISLVEAPVLSTA